MMHNGALLRTSPLALTCSSTQLKPLSRLPVLHAISRRHQTNSALGAEHSDPNIADALRSPKAERSALARLPTIGIIRSLLLGSFFTIPILFTPGFALMRKVATSQSFLLNPDRNPVLRALVKPLVYDQFCAGTTRAEIQKNIARIKGLGFKGVILCYGKELQIEKPSEAHAAAANAKEETMRLEVEAWRKGNLETLDMVGEGDWLGIKYDSFIAPNSRLAY